MSAEDTEDVGPPLLRATAPEHANNRSRSYETGRLFREEDSPALCPGGVLFAQPGEKSSVGVEALSDPISDPSIKKPLSRHGGDSGAFAVEMPGVEPGSA